MSAAAIHSAALEGKKIESVREQGVRKREHVPPRGWDPCMVE